MSQGKGPFSVTVSGQPKGEVYRKHARWYWRRGAIAVEPFSASMGLDTVRAWIAQVCRADLSEVRLIPPVVTTKPIGAPLPPLDAREVATLARLARNAIAAYDSRNRGAPPSEAIEALRAFLFLMPINPR